MHPVHLGLAIAAALLPFAGCQAADNDTVPTDGKSAGAVPLISQSTDGGGELCIPVDAHGRASFAWEAIRNTSDGDVTIDNVTLSRKDATVTDWHLTREDWNDAGVRSGNLPSVASVELPSTLTPHETAVVAFTVEASRLKAATTASVKVDYRTSSKERGTLPLVWTIRLMPTGNVCSQSAN